MHINLLRKKKQKSKKAIMMGLNYPTTRFKLFGCVNDVRNGKRFFFKKKYDVKVLIDKDITNEYNLLEALDELKNSDAKYLVFHYSGHGTQTKDINNDEIDGWDESVFSTNNTIITDDLIRKKLQEFKNKTVFLIFDCCHSGTIVDLPYKLNSNVIEIINNYHFDSNIICVSGCRSDQTSADVTENNISYGALSKTLYDILRKGNCKTWRNLSNSLQAKMKKEGYTQIPQLSASKTNLFDRFISF